MGCCVVLLVPGEGVILAAAAAQTPAASTAPATTAPATTAPATAAPASTTAEKPAAIIPPEQLEALVAPIALYPDPLLAQVLVASTYPLELIQLQQWMAKHPDLKDKALADSIAKQPWDSSVQTMAAVPEAVKRLADDIQWTTDLGNAFLAQQGDVMNAVQRMRKKAQDNGALESNEQQKVETKVVEEMTVIVVESANPEVIYVPSYSPTVVYGAPLYYPYPPIYYPPYPPGAALVTFGFGMAMGAAMWGGSCCGCGWGGNNVNINVNNNFNQINHNNNAGGGAGSGGGNWNHNPSHRGGTPYGDKATANKYGGASAGNRQAGAGASNRAGGGAGAAAGASNRAAGGAGASAGASKLGGMAGSGAGASNRAGASAGASNRGGGGGQVGSRNVPNSGGSRSGGAYGGGGSGGYSGSNARASSSRGSSSMGSRGGGGGSRGGGGRR